MLRCQNYDGGIGGEPGIEGHGGYAFCGLAAMEIMGKADLLDIPLLLVIICYLILKFEEMGIEILKIFILFF